MSYFFSKGHPREMLEDGLKMGKIKEERRVNKYADKLGMGDEDLQEVL